VSESGAGGGIQSVMQKCLPCTECEILKTAAWSVESRDCGRGRGGGHGAVTEEAQAAIHMYMYKYLCM